MAIWFSFLEANRSSAEVLTWPLSYPRGQSLAHGVRIGISGDLSYEGAITVSTQVAHYLLWPDLITWREPLQPPPPPPSTRASAGDLTLDLTNGVCERVTSLSDFCLQNSWSGWRLQRGGATCYQREGETLSGLAEVFIVHNSGLSLFLSHLLSLSHKYTP